MSWLGITFLLCFVLNGFTEARHYPPAAVLVGTVYCDTCFHRDFSEASHFISGASVAVECGHSRNGPSFRKEVKTDDHGEFRVHLPFSVSKHVKKIKGCSVKLINSSEPFCAVASSATSSSIHLKERKEGKHIFSAGFFTFKPLNQPELCNQKPSIHGGFKKINGADSPITDPNNPAFLPPIRDPPPAATPLLPPVPGVPQLPVQLPLPPIGIQIGNPLNPPAVRQEATFSPIIPGGIIPPLPELPPLLPSIPGLPLFPPESKKPKKPNKLATESQVTDEKIAQPRFFAPVGGLPPNPLLPPPSVLPPNPLLPPPSVLPPNPFLPPRSLLPPNPLLPPPSVVSPNPLQPPTSTPSLTPSTPSLTPSPPSLFPPLFQSPPPSAQPPVPLLPSPSFPTPIPRFPFQPTPLFPGVPPAATSTKKSSP